MESELPEWVVTEPSALAGVQVECRERLGSPRASWIHGHQGRGTAPRTFPPASQETGRLLAEDRAKGNMAAKGSISLLCRAHLFRSGKSGAQSPAVLCQKNSGIIPLKPP